MSSYFPRNKKQPRPNGGAVVVQTRAAPLEIGGRGDVTPAAFVSIIKALENFDILTSLKPNLSYLKEQGSYALSMQDRRLQNALRYIISTFFSESGSKNLHDTLDQLHYTRHQGTTNNNTDLIAGLNQDPSENGPNDGDTFAHNLTDFYDLFNRFVSMLLAYVHDTENQQHKQMDTHNPVHLIMHKWEMVMAYMSEIYAATRTLADDRMPTLTAFWHQTIEHNIQHISVLNGTILDYKEKINQIHLEQIKRDKEIDAIEAKYALMLNMLPLLQGELDKKQQQYNDLKTGAHYLPEFNNTEIPTKIPNITSRLRGADFSSVERMAAQIPYASIKSMQR